MKIYKKRLSIVGGSCFHTLRWPTTTHTGARARCLVEGGEAARAVAAYIDLNPMRAGLAKRPEDYRWCSYAAAVGGMRLARAGLVTAVSYDEQIPWAKAAESYRHRSGRASLVGRLVGQPD